MEDFKIKPEMIEGWKTYCSKNCMDPYSFGVMRATCAAFEVLDQGGTPEMAQAAWKGLGLTGYMAGAAAQSIAAFHERGEEFKKYWNTSWGVPDETRGVVNPALVTIKTKETFDEKH
jgi:hypothetical protein